MSWPESRVARDKSDFSSNRQATEAIAKMYKLKSPTGFALSIGLSMDMRPVYRSQLAR